MTYYSEFDIQCDNDGVLQLIHLKKDCFQYLEFVVMGANVPDIVKLCDIHKCYPKGGDNVYYHWDGTERKYELYTEPITGRERINWLESYRKSDYYLEEIASAPQDTQDN